MLVIAKVAAYYENKMKREELEQIKGWDDKSPHLNGEALMNAEK